MSVFSVLRGDWPELSSLTSEPKAKRPKSQRPVIFCVKRSPKKLITVEVTVIFNCIFKTFVLSPKPWCPPSVYSLAGKGTAPQGESSENTPQDVLQESGDEDTERDKTLLVPEFPGLWNLEFDLHKVNVMISPVKNRK